MIVVEELTRYYGKKRVLDNISFRITTNGIVGFLGPNGAGKTTTMRILSGFLRPTQGHVTVLNHDIIDNSLDVKHAIGYMPEQVPLYMDMTTKQYLEFAGRLRGLSKEESAKRTSVVIEECGLDEYSHTILSKLSKGYRQRAGLAQAIIHDPPVLILDEPTAGIDPIEVVQTRELIRKLGTDHTVFLSSHILSEIDMICDRIIVIKSGIILADDSINNLSFSLNRNACIQLELQDNNIIVEKLIGSIKGIIGIKFAEPYFFIEYEQNKEIRPELTENIIKEGYKLLSMKNVQASLEDIFIDLTAEKENRRKE
jgi:ABC-2 type transport system ATP-binding protein